MKRSLLSMVAGAMLVSGSVFAADTTTKTTTTFTNEQGTMIREYSTTKRYNSISDPRFEAKVGVELPTTVTTLYPLPETIKVTEPDRYRYVIINDRPIVVERSTRRVIHTW